jgi:hypothetical protein
MTKGQTDLNGAGPGLSAFSSANANERHAVWKQYSTLKFCTGPPSPCWVRMAKLA